MNLKFRELTLNDLPQIKKLSNSMGMLNDPKIGDTAEPLIKDPLCTLYGAFLEDKLVGVGGLRQKTKQLAQIEDIRVHGKFQKKGIGTALFNYGEQLAREQNYHRVGYADDAQKQGNKGKPVLIGLNRDASFCVLAKNDGSHCKKGQKRCAKDYSHNGDGSSGETSSNVFNT